MPVAEAVVDILPEPAPFIHGRPVIDSGGDEFAHIYAATGKATRIVRLAGPKEVDEAVASAREALAVWRPVPVDKRRERLLAFAAAIRRHSESLAVIQTVESGVPIRFAKTFPALAADHIEYNAGFADKIAGETVPTWPRPAFDYTISEPFGVVAMVVSWNAALPALGQLLGAALAAGNTIVLKPSEFAPFTAIRFGELALQAGLPEGAVNVVPAAAEASAALAGHPGVNKLHFTGSPATARRILRQTMAHLVPATLELGGKSALIVFEDADVGAAAQHALSGAVVLSGQGCANATRVIVHAKLRDQLLRLVKGFARRVVVGDPLDANTTMGPVVSQPALERILRLVGEAERTGAGRLLCGGRRLGDDLAAGYFIGPTLFADVDNRSALAQQEIFGPVVSFMTFESEKEAVRLANNSRYGLAGYVFTNDLKRAHRIASVLEVGNVWVNGLDATAPSAPFGGVKESGYGRLGGRAGIREFIRPKNVWIAMD